MVKEAFYQAISLLMWWHLRLIKGDTQISIVENLLGRIPLLAVQRI